MNKSFFISITLFSVFSYVNGQDSLREKLPQEPKGFVWQEIYNGKAAILKPKNWHFLKEEKEDSKSFFITKESIEKEGKYYTGLSLNVLLNMDKKTGVSPSEYAQVIGDTISKKYKLIDRYKTKVGKLNGFIIIIEQDYPNGKKYDKYTQHYYLCANDATGTLWLYVFESPNKYWKKMWEKFGEKMLYLLAIDDEI